MLQIHKVSVVAQVTRFIPKDISRKGKVYLSIESISTLDGTPL